MWTQTNERFLDRRGCGDELDLDADFKAMLCLEGIHGAGLNDVGDLEDAADDVAGH